jgi:hypothetical protein
MSRSVKSWTVAALLLFASALYCFYWVQSRGGFGRSPIEIPVRLEEGRSLSVAFSVRERGEHYVELQYPKAGAEGPSHAFFKGRDRRLRCGWIHLQFDLSTNRVARCPIGCAGAILPPSRNPASSVASPTSVLDDSYWTEFFCWFEVVPCTC